MRLWAVQLRVTSGDHATRILYPQFVVEAGDLDEAGLRVKERLAQENPGGRPPLGDITVRAAAEIGLESIWIFNDERFRGIG